MIDLYTLFRSARVLLAIVASAVLARLFEEFPRMTTRFRPGRMALAALAVFATVNAAAAPQVFKGASAPLGVLGIDPNGDAVKAKQRFLDALKPGSARTETLEAFSNGLNAPNDSPLTLEFKPASGDSSFGKLRMGMDSPFDAGKISDVTEESQTIPGRYNTTPGGQYYWDSYATFLVEFDQDVSAFGFYGTDFADFGGTLTLAFLRSDGSEVFSETLTPGTTGGEDDNALLTFYGFGETDPAKRFSMVRFRLKQPSESLEDHMGFDDFIVGEIATTPPVDLPEPATLALVGVSLLGLAATRRRTRR